MAYEEGNLEDRDSGHREHSDGGSDRDGHHLMYGPRTILKSDVRCQM